MLSPYHVRSLTPDRIAEAFPIVSLCSTAVTLEGWAEYAGDRIGDGDGELDHGILTVQNGQGHILGLAVYQVRLDLHRGRVLEIENFAVGGLVGFKNAVATLLSELEGLAKQEACTCVSISLLNPGLRQWMRASGERSADVFSAAGFRREPMRLRKCFESH